MSHRLLGAVALTLTTLASGCAPSPPAHVPAIEVCPPAPPAVECPALPSRGSTLRDLLAAWVSARAVHAECRAALGAWEDSHRRCHAPTPPDSRSP